MRNEKIGAIHQQYPHFEYERRIADYEEEISDLKMKLEANEIKMSVLIQENNTYKEEL